jgi:hypothetical protein
MYQVDLSQLQMVIAGYISIINMSLHNSYINFWKSNPRLAYLHELLACLCPSDAAAFLWRVTFAICPWFIVDVCFVINSFVYGYLLPCTER